MSLPPDLKNRIYKSGIIPILTVSDAKLAVPVAQALRDGGLSLVEVTLRTPEGLRAIEAIASQCPDILVIAGTLLKPEDFFSARSAGAILSVSPGFHKTLHESAEGAQLPWIPGVATASDLIESLMCDRTEVKLFPAVPLGGISALKSLSAPFPQVTFCPTGGIGLNTMNDYLACKEVLAVGGSWIISQEALRDRSWEVIQKNAQKAHKQVQALRS
jgi:2-dehydro-3-deoxyphosphogluconate aldolase/(4S)-4-hydroxy-2-oxoglutarate aldolase